MIKREGRGPEHPKQNPGFDDDILRRCKVALKIFFLDLKRGQTTDSFLLLKTLSRSISSSQTEKLKVLEALGLFRIGDSGAVLKSADGGGGDEASP